jgi:hypothetical protein
VLRSFTIDMLLWLAAGLAAPLGAMLDPRIAPVLKAAKVEPAGNFTLARESQPGEREHSAVLGDRADIVEFAEAVCDDIASGRYAYLFLHDVIDIASRRLISAAREQGIAVELLPGPRSSAAFDLAGGDARAALPRLLQAYVAALGKAPEHLRSTRRGEAGMPALSGAFRDLLSETWQSCAALNRGLRLGGDRPAGAAPRQGEPATALAFVSELCAILDPRINPIAAITGREYGEKAQQIRRELAQLPAGDSTAIVEHLFSGYELLWRYFHFVESLHHHSLADNETFALALSRAGDCRIAPKPFKPFRDYDFFYRFQEFQLRHWSVQAPTFGFERSLLAGDLDHFVRQWQLLGLIEMLFTILRRERPDETIRWLDLGCGRGFIANSVRVEDCLPDGKWQIVGVDRNQSSVSIANKRAGPRRIFLVGDAREAVEQIGAERFNIISAFEFIEHLEDPVRTLKGYVPFCSDFFIAGSPLAEAQNWLPSASHVWTFNRRGFEELFSAVGLRPTFANEAYVGRFGTGMNWVTIIAGAHRTLPAQVAVPPPIRRRSADAAAEREQPAGRYGASRQGNG